MTLSKNYNFTYSLYKRLDGVWGGLETIDNVTKTTGILSNLVDGSANLVAGAFGISTLR